MSKIQVGDKIKDNDPRTTNRVLQVIEINQTYCYADPGHSFPVVRIRLDRIHTDGKQRRSGFDLLTWEGALRACQDEAHVLEGAVGMELGRSRISSRIRQCAALLDRAKQQEQRLRELEEVLQEAIGANPFSRPGWINRAKELLK